MGRKRRYKTAMVDVPRYKRGVRRAHETAERIEVPVQAARHILEQAIDGRMDTKRAVVAVHNRLVRLVATLRTTRQVFVTLANEPLTLTGLAEWEAQQQQRLPGMEG
jgi:hypothetical protein